MLMKKLFNIAAISADEVSVGSVGFHSCSAAVIKGILYAAECSQGAATINDI